MPFFRTLSRDEVTEEFPPLELGEAAEPGVNKAPGYGYKMPPVAGLVGNIGETWLGLGPKGLEAGLDGGLDPSSPPSPL